MLLPKQAASVERYDNAFAISPREDLNVSAAAYCNTVPDCDPNNGIPPPEGFGYYANWCCPANPGDWQNRYPGTVAVCKFPNSAGGMNCPGGYYLVLGPG